MRTPWLISLVLLAATACSGPASGDRLYKWNDLMLVTSYTAKDTCTCLFVMNQTEEYCRAWTKAAPAIATWSADTKAKTVEASAVLFWGAKAHFVSEHLGCVLE